MLRSRKNYDLSKSTEGKQKVAIIRLKQKQIILFKMRMFNGRGGRL